MENINKILEERIDYYTGGDELKSIAESTYDIIIVKELKYIKKRISSIDEKDLMLKAENFLKVNGYRDRRIDTDDIHTDCVCNEDKKYVSDAIVSFVKEILNDKGNNL